jgi:hypothetical protein
MRRTALTLAGLFAALAAALSSCGRNPSAPTGPSNLVSVKVVAPPTIAPGSTAQLAALANYTDGSSKDVTAAVQWHSSDTSILTISATGLAAGVHVGDVNITAASSAGVSGTQSIVVAPAGTFRLWGQVTGFGLPVNGALVQVTAGIGAGLSSSTDGGGTYRLYGVAGDIQLTVSKTTYVTVTQTVTVNSNTSLNVDLMPPAPPADLTGTYTLAIRADPACTTTDGGALPSVARQRRYTATITPAPGFNPPGGAVKVALSGATFAPDSLNAFYGGLTSDGATFGVNDPMYYYCGCRDLAEVLPDGHLYLVSGAIGVTRSGNDLVGSLNGTITIALGPDFGNVVAQCTSAHHSVTFTTQSGSPARVRTRR